MSERYRIITDVRPAVAEDVIDMVAKTLLLRSGAASVDVSWEELEKAADTRCELVKHGDGVTLRIAQSGKH